MLPNNPQNPIDAQLLKASLDAISGAVIVLDERLFTLYANPTAEELLQTSLKTLSQKPFSFVLPPHSSLLAQIQDVMATKRPALSHTSTIRTPLQGAPLNINADITLINPSPPTVLLQFQPLKTSTVMPPDAQQRLKTIMVAL